MPTSVSAEQMTNVPNRELSEQEKGKIVPSAQDWSNALAKEIAVNNFTAMESFRSQSHDWRFSNADQLYLAWVPQKTWEGTRIPRSSIGIYLALEQIESMLPGIMSALFPMRDNIEVFPRPGSTVQQARASFDLLMYQFDSLGIDGYAKLQETINRCLKQAFIYGNGILELGWQYKELTERYYYHTWKTPTRQVFDPATQQVVNAPIGNPVRQLHSDVVKRCINQPLIEARDIRDFYIDPNCPSPNIQDARFCATRHLLTIGEIKSYAGQPAFNVPSDETLKEMAKNKQFTRGDQGKRMTESYRLSNWAPQQDYTVDAAKQRVEVIRYWDRERTVWLLNRNWVMLNTGNPYGFLPFLDAFYVDVPGRFYGLAVTDLVEGEQRLQQSIINARIDELALTIHAPFAKKRGTALPQTSLRVGPGRVIELDDPKNDLIKIEYPNITASAHIEVQASELRTQKYTGVTDLATLGTPTGGGNSANRTATGVQTQSAASGKRMGYIVQRIEATFLEPLCAMCHDLNKKFIDPRTVMTVLGPDAKNLTIDPLDVLNANVHFQMRASDKLRSRMAVLQSLPMILQTILNPAVLQLLAQQQQQTVDIKQVMLMVTDALNVAPMSLFRPMTGNETQGMMTTNPEVMKLMAANEMQNSRLSAQTDHVQRQGDTELLKTIYSALMQNAGLQKALTGYSPSEGESGASSTQ